MQSVPILFAGPSLHGPDGMLRPAGIQLHPPAARGDIERATAGVAEPGIVILADGVFRATPAVGHRELLSALRTGWAIWGVSSMGAIRAYELRDCGMRGFGRAYEEFFRHEDLTDDEFALIHAPDPIFEPLSEPLIDLRLFIRDAIAQASLTQGEGDRILKALAQVYFADRTRHLVDDMLLSAFGERANGLIGAYAAHKAKARDLRTLLDEAPWKRRT